MGIVISGGGREEGEGGGGGRRGRGEGDTVFLKYHLNGKSVY